MRINRWGAVLLLGLPLVFMLAFFIIPFAVVVLSSLHNQDGLWTFQNYVKAFTDFYYWETLLFTFEVSAWVTLVTFVVGYPLAYFLTYVIQNRILRRLFYVIVVTPLFTSNIVRAFGWMVLLGRRGLVNDTLMSLGLLDRPAKFLFTELGIIIGLSYIMTPFMVLTVASVLQNIDRSLEDAALDLGANRLVTFLKVTFPLSLPGVIAGSLIIFTLSVSAYVTPSILSGGKETVMSMLIFQQYTSVFNFEFGATLAVVLLVATLLIIAAYLFVVERRPRTA